MQLQPAVKNFLLALSALGAIAVFSMAQAPVTITPGTGQVYAANGTATMPTVSFALETGLGLYRISSGVLGIANDQYNAAAPLGSLSTAGMTLAGTSTGYRFTAGSDGSAAADTVLSRAGVGQFGWTAVLFANLGTPSNGAFCYCSDCTIASPCASGGTGALAKRLNGSWVCN